MWNHAHNDDPTLGNSLFGVVKLVKDADIYQYKYSEYGTGFDMKQTFWLPAIGFARNVTIFGVDTSSFPNIDNKKKDTLILGKDPTQGLDHTLTAEKMFSINFTE